MAALSHARSSRLCLFGPRHGFCGYLAGWLVSRMVAGVWTDRRVTTWEVWAYRACSSLLRETMRRLRG
jgi:hypothetical protein